LTLPFKKFTKSYQVKTKISLKSRTHKHDAIATAELFNKLLYLTK